MKIKNIKIDIELTEIQKKHIDAARWLFGVDGKFREGRSSLLAIVFIEKAIKEIGNWIKPIDHSPYDRDNLIFMILQILDTNKKIRFEYNKNRSEFKITHIEP